MLALGTWARLFVYSIVTSAMLVGDTPARAGIDLCTGVVCDDQDGCTTESCNPATGECVVQTVDCDDGNGCTIDTCDSAKPTAEACSHTPIVCDDQDGCTTEYCDPAIGQCVVQTVDCDDGDGCTIDTCDSAKPTAEACSHTPLVCDTYKDGCTNEYCDPAYGNCVVQSVNCDDADKCTVDDCDRTKPTGEGCSHTPVVCDTYQDGCTNEYCDPANGYCVVQPVNCDDADNCTLDDCDRTKPTGEGCSHTPVVCDDADGCTTDDCDPANGQCTHTRLACNDQDACTRDACDPATGQCVHTPIVTCDDGNPCTSDQCNPATGTCVYGEAVHCDDGDVCTDDRCDPQTGECVHDFDAENDPSCAPSGCRITGAGVTAAGEMDLSTFADTAAGYLGGQVGSSCGCIGCYDVFDKVQGQWRYQRKKQKSSFRATDINSLKCGCNGTFDGRLCDAATGPEPPASPANMACFTGKGTLREHGKVSQAVFRVDAEDHGEPGAGADKARVRIWVPRGQETIEGLAAGSCCDNDVPTGDAARRADVDDGGDLLHGNLQIHPEIAAHAGFCPDNLTSCCVPTPEVCDGLDNDCDGVIDNDATGPNVTLAAGSSPAGYLPLSAFGISPVPGVTDDSITNFNVPAFVFAGLEWTQLGVSSNGYLVVGGGSGPDNSINNQSFPNPARPNNVLAPFWTDLNPEAGGAIRIGTLTDGVNTWIVVDWDGLREFSNAAPRHSFEVWIGIKSNGPGEDISFAYGVNTGNGDGGFLSVGVENLCGNRGNNTYFNGTGTLPTDGTELRVTTTP